MLAREQHNKPKQHGGALLYILIAIGLLGALTASLSGNSGTLNTSQNTAKIKMELRSQIEFIRSAINECVTNYPNGDPTINSSSTTDPGYIAPYPLDPKSTHFTGSTLGVEANRSASLIRCPGNPGVDNNHTPIFGGNSGLTFPPTLYDIGWNYYNRSESVLGENVHGSYIRAGTIGANPAFKNMLSDLASEYGECEADYIEGTGGNGCDIGKTCIRIWIVRPNGC